jgi:hypothetical protein
VFACRLCCRAGAAIYPVVPTTAWRPYSFMDLFMVAG